MDVSNKRKRALNWDDMEKSLLKECVREYIPIIENKSTDTNTNKKKTLAWRVMSQRFNEINIRERTPAELKQQWRAMKNGAKKSSSNNKKTTGEDLKPLSPDQNASEFMEIIPQEFEDDTNKFDNDRILKNENQCFTPHNENHRSTDKKRKIETLPDIRNKIVVNCIEEEHKLKMTQMSEAHNWAKENHNWAREEHEIKMKKIRLEIKLLEREIGLTK